MVRWAMFGRSTPRRANSKWTFHTVAQKGEFGNDTWAGDSWNNCAAVNAWSILSIDVLACWALCFCFADFAGGGSRLAAIEKATVYLAIRLWPSMPTQVSAWALSDRPSQSLGLRFAGATEPGECDSGTRDVDSVAALEVTKTGFVFVFDRYTGKPLFDVEERSVPASDVPGEQAAISQPFPLKPAPFARQTMKSETNSPMLRPNPSLLRQTHGRRGVGDALYSRWSEADGAFSRNQRRSKLGRRVVRSAVAHALCELDGRRHVISYGKAARWFRDTFPRARIGVAEFAFRGSESGTHARNLRGAI